MRFLIMCFVAGLFLGGAAQAQEPSRQAVTESMEACKTIDVEFMRRACLEAAEDFLKRAPDEEAVALVPETNVTDVADPVLEAVGSVSDDTVSDSADIAGTADAEEAVKRRRFGLIPRAEQSESGRESLAVSVTNITTNRQGYGRFRLSDGSLLVQFPSGYSVRDPASLPASARLERRLFGSKWLIFDEYPNRGYKVRVIPKED